MTEPNDFGFRPDDAIIGEQHKPQPQAKAPQGVEIFLDAESAAVIAEYMMQGYRKKGLAIVVSASSVE
jgi:hypothetical protein